MADNASILASQLATADEVTYSGDTTKLQIMRLVHVSGSEGAKTVNEISDASFGIDVDVTRLPRAGTATLANVSGSATSVTLQASNGARRSVIIVNDSSATLYVKYGSSASTTSYTFQLQAGETLREDIYTGIVTGIWASATGDARVTELAA